MNFFQIRNDEMSVEDDDYSVIINDERKRPAKPSPSRARRRLNIKMGEEKAEKGRIEPS